MVLRHVVCPSSSLASGMCSVSPLVPHINKLCLLRCFHSFVPALDLSRSHVPTVSLAKNWVSGEMQLTTALQESPASRSTASHSSSRQFYLGHQGCVHSPVPALAFKPLPAIAFRVTLVSGLDARATCQLHFLTPRWLRCLPRDTFQLHFITPRWRRCVQSPAPVLTLLSSCNVFWSGGALSLKLEITHCALCTVEPVYWEARCCQTGRTDLRSCLPLRFPLRFNSLSLWAQALSLLAIVSLLWCFPVGLQHVFSLTSASKELSMSGHVSLILQGGLSPRFLARIFYLPACVCAVSGHTSQCVLFL